MQRCKKDYGDAVPQIRWWLHPLGYAEAARASTPEGKRRKGKSILEVLRNQGVGAVEGIGGLVDFASEGLEIVHRTAIYAPPPYKKAMKMAVLPNRTDFMPQPWAPHDVATYATFYFDILNAFDNFGPLFDELFGQGANGAWIDAVEGLEKDPNGPQINLRKELIRTSGPARERADGLPNAHHHHKRAAVVRHRGDRREGRRRGDSETLQERSDRQTGRTQRADYLGVCGE